MVGDFIRESMMTTLKPEQLGICSWSLRPKEPAELVRGVRNLGLKRVQLALNAVRDPNGPWARVQEELAAADIEVCSGMFGTVGEDYSSLESIKRTGGVVQDAHWDANWHIAQDVAAVAKRMGLSMVSFHAGFIPDDAHDPTFAKLQQRIARIADLFKDHGLTLVFETGQETAAALWQFLDTLARPNVGINFDPANMILYDKGDPIASLRKLMPRVRQVHIKDARRTQVPGSWGLETPIGEGEVDWKAFLRTLAEADYTGNLVIEREAGGDRAGDVRRAIERLIAMMQ